MENNSLKEVEQYLDGLMSKKDRQVFEDRLSKDDSLQKLLEFAKFEQKIIATNLHNNRLDKINKWDKAYQKKKQQRNLIKVAGILILGIILGAILWNNWFSPSPKEKDFNQFDAQVVALYTPPASLTDRINQRTKSEIEQALKRTSLTIEEKYFLGHQLINAGAYKKAETIFKELIADVNYGLQAEWYFVFCFYAINQHATEENSILKSILSDSQHPFFEEAQQLQKLILERSK